MCVISAAFGLADEYVQGGMVGDWSFMRHEFSFLAGLAASGAITSGLRMITKGVLDIHKMVYETEQVAKLGIFKDISGTSHYSVCLGDVTKTQQRGASRSCANTTYEPPINDSVPVAESSTSVFNKRRRVLSEGSSAKHRDTVGASQENNIHMCHAMQGIIKLYIGILYCFKTSFITLHAKETVDKAAHMAKPNNYINGTRKNLVSSDNEGRMVEKCIVEIQGTFLEKIRNDAFNEDEGENTYEHLNRFLDIVDPIKNNGLTQDRFRLSIFPVSLIGVAHEWFTKEFMGSITTWDSMVEKFILKFHHLSDHNDDEEEEDSSETDNAPEFFMIEGNLFDFETPLCKAYNKINYLLKFDTDLFTYDIQSLKELPEMVRVGTMTYFQDHSWYDELADGKLKDETLTLKTKIKELWGDAAPGVIKFCRWLKSCFENFYELECEVLMKLQDCWWKVNTHKIAPFTRMENFGRASNVGQEDQGNKDDPILEPSIYKVRRFEMMKYLFDNDEACITINESKYLEHSKDSLDVIENSYLTLN
ncbi:ribosomal protein L7Ae/L30e/S12e/Gadd45 [Tanacetum coccineum]|uniref:Ribosomal protein L7Ae/L30e/S12e/Gadd45 n=1 Tax=Tanacetum coccineum TaxID=301880 RepID=A0ABQ4ZTT1_9ASTR